MNALATTAAVLLATVSLAQNPNVQDEFFSGRLRQQGDALVFCTWDRAATGPLDAAIAHKSAEILLLDVRVEVIEQDVDLSGEEMLQWIWVLLSDECDLFLGFNLVTGIYPAWLTPSRPYLDAPYVAAVSNQEYSSLADVPRGSLVGSQLYTQLDNILTVNLREQGEQADWRRLPYDDPEMLLHHVNEGIIEAGILWGPRYSALLHDGLVPDGVKTVDLPPSLASITDQIGAMAFTRNSWLISEFDAAISELIQSEELARLIREHDIHARVPNTR